jgi:hypothetical protein
MQWHKYVGIAVKRARAVEEDTTIRHSKVARTPQEDKNKLKIKKSPTRVVLEVWLAAAKLTLQKMKTEQLHRESGIRNIFELQRCLAIFLKSAHVDMLSCRRKNFSGT